MYSNETRALLCAIHDLERLAEYFDPFLKEWADKIRQDVEKYKRALLEPERPVIW